MTIPTQHAMAQTASRSLAGSSFVLLLGKGSQMGAGLIFWVIAARSASVRDVGLATATVSAVMACTQIALLGAGSAVITEARRVAGRWSALLHATFTAVLASSALAGVAYLVASARFSRELRTVLAQPALAALFVAATVLGTVLICLDQVSVAIDRSSQQAVRYLAAGATTIATALAAAFALPEVSATVLFACWSAGAAVACAIGVVQLRRALGYRYRPTGDLRQIRALLRVGLPNQVLTLTERLPALIVPLLVAELAAPELAARWYPAWMMAWGVYNAPIMVGLVQFAKSVQRPDEVRATARSAVRWSLLLGGPLALIVALAADPLLGVLGGGYAEASAGGLRILVAGLVPYTLLQAYNAACRATGRLREAIAVGAVAALSSIGATLAAARLGDVTAMAAAWFACSAAVAVLAAVRLRQISAVSAQQPSPRLLPHRAGPVVAEPGTESPGSAPVPQEEMA
jgi:O-antigen/teichoic acid export membrane protein